jgi:hypothetical protein
MMQVQGQVQVPELHPLGMYHDIRIILQHVSTQRHYVISTHHFIQASKRSLTHALCYADTDIRHMYMIIYAPAEHVVDVNVHLPMH